MTGLPPHVQAVLDELQRNGSDNLECPVCIDTPENPVLTLCGHVVCRACLFSAAQYAGHLRCPVCRAAVDKNTIVYLPGSVPEPELTLGDDDVVGNKLVSFEDQWRSSTKIDRLMCELKELHAWNVASQTAATCATRGSKRVCRGAAAPGDDLVADVGGGGGSGDGTRGDDVGGPEVPPGDAVVDVVPRGVSPPTRKRRAPVLDDPTGAAADAVPELPSCLCGIVMAPPVHVLVISQWTGMLDLIEVALRNSGITYGRLDGSQSQRTRERVLSSFKDSMVEVLLVSMRAGCLGLNLCKASLVYLCDPWWNPAVEDQAINRVHRLGQTKPVLIKRLVVSGTVETALLALQEKKRAMANSALSSTATQSDRMSFEDLLLLFR